MHLQPLALCCVLASASLQAEASMIESMTLDLNRWDPSPSLGIEFLEAMAFSEISSVAAVIERTQGGNSVRVDCLWLHEHRLGCQLPGRNVDWVGQELSVTLETPFYSSRGELWPGETYHFTTTPGQIRVNRVEWSPDQIPRIMIEAIPGINAEKLAESLLLKGPEGQYLHLQAQPSEQEPLNDRSLIDFEPNQPLEGKWQLFLASDITFGPARSAIPGQWLASLVAPDAFEVLGVSCWRDRQNRNLDNCDPEQGITLELSAPPSEKTLVQLREATGNRARIVVSSYPNWQRTPVYQPNPTQININRVTPDILIRLRMNELACDQMHRCLSKPWRTDVRFGDLSPMLAFGPNRWDISDSPGSAESAPMVRNLPKTSLTLLELGEDLPHTREFVVPDDEIEPNALVAQPLPVPRSEISARVVATPDGRLLGGQLFEPPLLELIRYPEQALAWVHARDGSVLANVDLMLYQIDDATQRFDEVASIRTDADGIALLPLPQAAWSNPQLFWLKVVTDERASWLPLDHTGTLIKTPRSSANDEPYWWSDLREGELTAWGWTNKPVYQAGETIEYRMFLRQRRANQLVVPNVDESMAVYLHSANSLLNRGGMLLRQQIDRLEEFGSVRGEFQIPEDALDGRYWIGFEGASNDGPFTEQYHGPEFKVGVHSAADISLTVNVEADDLALGMPVPVNGRASFYSGGPVTEGVINAEVKLRPASPAEFLTNWRDFLFLKEWSLNEETFQDIDHMRDGSDFSSTGTFTETIDWPEHADPNDWPFMALTVFASVTTDANGHAMAKTEEIPVSEEQWFVGFKTINHSPERPWQTDGFELVIIDETGVTKADWQAELSIAEVVDEGETSFSFECDASPSQPYCQLPPLSYGLYQVTAEATNAQPVTRELWLGSRQAGKPSPLQLSIVNRVPVTEEVLQIAISQPFDTAAALITVEHGQLLHREIIQLSSQKSLVDLPIRDEWRPGFTLGLHVLSRDEYPDRPLLGAQVRVKLDQPASVPSISVVTDRQEFGPGDHVTLSLHSSRDNRSLITVAVVDEAILALAPDITEFLDPDSNSYLGLLDTWEEGELQRALRASDDRSNATIRGLPNYWTEKARTIDSTRNGTGEEAADLDRVQVTGSRIRLSDLFDPLDSPDDSRVPDSIELNSGIDGYNRTVEGRWRANFAHSAFWSSEVVLDRNATTELNFQLPDSLTTWRIMVLSADESGDFEMVEHSILTTQPTEARIRTPGDLIPGDSIELRGSIRHRGQNPMDGEWEWTALRGEEVESRLSQPWSLAQNEVEPALMDLNVDKPGRIDLLLSASSDSARDGIRSSLRVGDPWQTTKSVMNWRLTGQSFEVVLPDALASNPLTLAISRALFPQVSSTIDWWAEYPHQCWEQLASRALVASMELVRSRAESNNETRSEFENDPLEALALMGQFQDWSGGLTFFRSDNGADGSFDLSVYTAWVLAQLKSRGVDLPVQATENLVEYFSTENSWSDSEPDEYQALMAAVALAYLRSEQAPVRDELLEKVDLSTLDFLDIALLWPVVTEGGQLAGALEEVLKDRVVQNSGRIDLDCPDCNSWLVGNAAPRDLCALRWALNQRPSRNPVLADPLPWIASIADSRLGSPHFGETQSNLWCLLLADEARLDRAPASASIDYGGEGYELSLDPEQDETSVLARIAEPDTVLSVEGTPGISFKAIGEVSEDLRSAQADSRGMSIDRQVLVWRDRGWTSVDSDDLAVGDFIRIDLAVQMASARHHVAVTDYLPGGMRPVDPELTGTLPPAALESTLPSAFRERRLGQPQSRFYALRLGAGVHRLSYYAEVTHAGRFHVLPAEVELLYDDSRKARSAASIVPVTSPETD